VATAAWLSPNGTVDAPKEGVRRASCERAQGVRNRRDDLAAESGPEAGNDVWHEGCDAGHVAFVGRGGRVASKDYTAIVGIDFSDLSNQALDQALEVTGLHAGEVHVVYVEPDLPQNTMLLAPLVEPTPATALLEQVRLRATERLAAVQARGTLGVKRVVVHVRHGSAAEEIAQLAADLDADLVVVGSHGRRGLSRVLLGSVAERVSRLARCPVWIIRPKDHQAINRAPEIEPPCPQCVARRAATNGAELWCARHAEHHIRAHTYSYVNDVLVGNSAAAYAATPERGA
jgi:nucleotide-binding universal stress UspA family protein